MPPKRKRVQAHPKNKRNRDSTTTDNGSNSGPALAVHSAASIDQLKSLPARVLRSQLLAHSLPTTGNKAALAKRLYYHFHTPNSRTSTDSNDGNVAATPLPQTSSSQITITTQDTSPPSDHGVFLPQLFADQLTNLVRHLTPAVPQSTVMETSLATTATVTMAGIQPPTNGNLLSTTTNQLPAMLPAAVNQLQPSTSQYVRDHEVLSAASPIPLTTNANVTNYHTANTFPTIRSTDDHSTVAINPTSIIDPTQFIDFITLLPKAMFSSGIELDNANSFTVQLPSNSGDLSVRTAVKPKRITSFSDWMQAWNIYLAVCVDHMPSRASSLVAYQRIITSASVQYPLESWLTYDVQFRMLAASDPSLRWDMRHADLWLQCLTPTSTQQPKRWPCIHCGATNHYPDHCPFRPHIAKQTPGGPGDTNRGQLNIRTPTTATPTHSNHTSFNSHTRYCWDFNRATCQRLQCKFAHRCEKCGASHPARICPTIRHSQTSY